MGFRLFIVICIIGRVLSTLFTPLPWEHKWADLIVEDLESIDHKALSDSTYSFIHRTNNSVIQDLFNVQCAILYWIKLEHLPDGSELLGNHTNRIWKARVSRRGWITGL